jgi:hypothetical protein
MHETLSSGQLIDLCEALGQSRSGNILGPRKSEMLKGKIPLLWNEYRTLASVTFFYTNELKSFIVLLPLQPTVAVLALQQEWPPERRTNI